MWVFEIPAGNIFLSLLSLFSFDGKNKDTIEKIIENPENIEISCVINRNLFFCCPDTNLSNKTNKRKGSWRHGFSVQQK